MGFSGQNIGTGGGGGGSTPTSQTNIIAHAGGGQGSATPAIEDFNSVITVATSGDSIILKPAELNKQQLIQNDSATNSMDVFPASGQQFELQGTNLGVNIPIPIAAGNGMKVYCFTTGIYTVIN